MATRILIWSVLIAIAFVISGFLIWRATKEWIICGVCCTAAIFIMTMGIIGFTSISNIHSMASIMPEQSISSEIHAFCFNCGYGLKETENYCPSCGEKR